MNSIAKRSHNINQLQRFVFICVNSWLSKYFQKTLKIPNKANLEIDPMSVTKVLTSDYNRRTLGVVGKTKPIQSQSKPNEPTPTAEQLSLEKRII